MILVHHFRSRKLPVNLLEERRILFVIWQREGLVSHDHDGFKILRPHDRAAP